MNNSVHSKSANIHHKMTEPSSYSPIKKGNIFQNKKILVFGVIGLIMLVLITLLVVSLNKRNNPVDNSLPVTITVWGKSIDESVMAELILEFERENPLIKVKYERQPNTDYKGRIETRLQIQNVSALPDMLEVDTSWLIELSKYLKVVNNPEIMSRFASQAIENNKVNTLSYGIPFNFDALVLAYNVNQLAEINLSEENFNQLDWSSLVTRAKNLTQTTSKTQNNIQYDALSRGGIAIGSPESVTNADKILQLLLIQNEADIYNTTTKKFEIDSKFDAVLDFYTKFATEYVWDDTLGNDIEAFTEGKVSMVLVRSKDIDIIKSKNPSLKFNTVLPAKIGSIKNIAFGTSLAFPRVKSTQPQAIKFAEFLTKKENQLKLYNADNRATFVPYNQNSLNEIPKESPFAIYSDIAPTAELFKTPNYELTTEVIDTFLLDSFQTNFSRLKPGDVPTKFMVNTATLENTLNKLVILTPSPTSTPIK